MAKQKRQKAQRQWGKASSHSSSNHETRGPYWKLWNLTIRTLTMSPRSRLISTNFLTLPDKASLDLPFCLWARTDAADWRLNYLRTTTRSFYHLPLIQSRSVTDNPRSTNSCLLECCPRKSLIPTLSTRTLILRWHNPRNWRMIHTHRRS